MHPAVLVSLTLGSLGVVQAALNRRLAAQWGLAPAILLNGVVVMSLCIVFYVAARRGYIDAITHDGVSGSFRFSWLLPGLFGFLLITGLPWAIGKIGATQVFVGVVFAQMVTSLVWDRVVEGLDWSWGRFAGACLCAAGVAIASWFR